MTWEPNQRTLTTKVVTNLEAVNFQITLNHCLLNVILNKAVFMVMLSVVDVKYLPMPDVFFRLALTKCKLDV